MNVEHESNRIVVPEEFEELFSHFYTARNETQLPVHKTLLPSFQTIMVFSFGTSINFKTTKGNTLQIDKAIVLGPIKQPIDYTLQPGVDMLVINFKSDGFYRFFGKAVITASIHPDELLNENCFTKLWYSLKDLSKADRISFILEFSRPYIKDKDATLAQLESYSEDNTVNPVKAIAYDTNQSERTIQLKHKKLLGYSAKEIARYQRFLKTIEFVGQSISDKDKHMDWQACVDRFGYYDQSQLIHDFKHYLNLSPTQFLKFQEDICVAKPL
jgi:AraC-like DNA-binding protein